MKSERLEAQEGNDQEKTNQISGLQQGTPQRCQQSELA